MSKPTAFKPHQIPQAINKKIKTQKDIADKVGVSEAYISMLRTGKRKLNPDNERHVILFNNLLSL